MALAIVRLLLIKKERKKENMNHHGQEKAQIRANEILLRLTKRLVQRYLLRKKPNVRAHCLNEVFSKT